MSVSGVLLNDVLLGGIALPNSLLFGGIVPPHSVLLGLQERGGFKKRPFAH